MRSTTKKLTTALGFTVALALSGGSVTSTAQAQVGVGNPDANLPGYSARPEGMCWYAQGPGGQDISGHWEHCRNAPASRTTERREPAPRTARAQRTSSPPQPASRPQPVNADTTGLPGYSARPSGMCWYAQGPGGQDISGHWERCRSR